MGFWIFATVAAIVLYYFGGHLYGFIFLGFFILLYILSLIKGDTKIGEKTKIQKASSGGSISIGDIGSMLKQVFFVILFLLIPAMLFGDFVGYLKENSIVAYIIVMIFVAGLPCLLSIIGRSNKK